MGGCGAQYWLGYAILCAAAIVLLMTMGVWAYFLDPGTEDDEQWMAAFVEQWTGPYIVFWLTAFVSILSLMVKRLWDLAINAWVLPMGMLAPEVSTQVTLSASYSILSYAAQWVFSASEKVRKSNPVQAPESALRGVASTGLWSGDGAERTDRENRH